PGSVASLTKYLRSGWSEPSRDPSLGFSGAIALRLPRFARFLGEKQPDVLRLARRDGRDRHRRLHSAQLSLTPKPIVELCFQFVKRRSTPHPAVDCSS